MEITKRDLKKQTEEIKRHNDVLYEKFEGKIDVVSEGWETTKEKVDATFEMVGEMKMDMEVVKSDISFIKNSLKQKVDKDEFISLEKRVILLENKLKRV